VPTLSGAGSHVSKCEYRRVASIKEWAEFWKKHKGQKAGEEYDLHYDPVPLIDFDRFMVIAIFQGGRWNSAGLKAVSIQEHNDSIIFRFDDKSYQTIGPDGGGKQVTVYGFFSICKCTSLTINSSTSGAQAVGRP
jgi:hypothetical protein